MYIILKCIVQNKQTSVMNIKLWIYWLCWKYRGSQITLPPGEWSLLNVLFIASFGHFTRILLLLKMLGYELFRLAACYIFIYIYINALDFPLSHLFALHAVTRESYIILITVCKQKQIAVFLSCLTPEPEHIPKLRIWTLIKSSTLADAE